MGLRTWLGIKKPKPRPRTWHGPYSDGLWGEVELALSYGGLAPEIAFNANAQDSAYRLGFAPLPWLDVGNCRLFVETLTPSAWRGSGEATGRAPRRAGRLAPRHRHPRRA